MDRRDAVTDVTHVCTAGPARAEFCGIQEFAAERLGVVLEAFRERPVGPQVQVALIGRKKGNALIVEGRRFVL